MLPTTWFYLSSLMIVAIFFKFNRFWSIRNLDLVGLVLTTPGLLFLAMNHDKWGYLWLYVAGVVLMIRLFLDLFMVRRPLLEPNLNPSGMSFACVLILGFMLANITINRGDSVQSLGTLRLEQILTMKEWNSTQTESLRKPPGFPPFYALVDMTNQVLAPDRSFIHHLPPWKDVQHGTLSLPKNATPVSHPPETETTNPGELTLDKELSEMLVSVPVVQVQEEIVYPDVKESFWITFVAIGAVSLAQLAIALGLIYIAHCHFNNLYTGISAATLYFLLPYTNQMTGRLDHVLPAALIVWAVAMYRRPVFSGIMIGLASSLVFYPFFLVALWCSFYWKRGMIRFLTGTVSMIALFYLLLLLSPGELGTYSDQLLNMLGLNSLFMANPDGLWLFYPTSYRIPLMAVYIVFCLVMLIWPSRKNLASLITCSTILLLGTQFWKAWQGGLFMAWYLPLLLLVFFRPNLEDRVASTTVIDYRKN